jgi:exosome complex exonuclease RRP6
MSMLSKLEKAKEVAIDLEHHNYRTYWGITCLMQISTREEDWVVDVLEPEVRDSMASLNSVFTDPNIVKVAHSFESLQEFLTRPLKLDPNRFFTAQSRISCGSSGISVSILSTYLILTMRPKCSVSGRTTLRQCVLHAKKVGMKSTEFPAHSLASLLSLYCDFNADKRYQTADWRIRPLPEEMLHYARADTHFLLLVYDHLRTALFSRSTLPEHASPTALIEEVLYRSSRTGLRAYEFEQYDYVSGCGSNGWRALAKRWNKGAEWRLDLSPGAKGSGTGLDFEVFRALHDWRDRVARAEDESPVFVMPNPTLYKLSTQRPTEPSALIVCASPVPPLVHVRAAELAKVIADAVNEHVEDSGAAQRAASKQQQQQKQVEVAGSGEMDWEPALRPAEKLWNADCQCRLS